MKRVVRGGGHGGFSLRARREKWVGRDPRAQSSHHRVLLIARNTLLSGRDLVNQYTICTDRSYHQ